MEASLLLGKVVFVGCEFLLLLRSKRSLLTELLVCLLYFLARHFLEVTKGSDFCRQSTQVIKGKRRPPFVFGWLGLIYLSNRSISLTGFTRLARCVKQ